MPATTTTTTGIHSVKEAIELSKFLATEALEATTDSDSKIAAYWTLRNALSDIRRMMLDAEAIAAR